MARLGGPPGDKLARDLEATSARASFSVGAEDTAVDAEMSDWAPFDAAADGEGESAVQRGGMAAVRCDGAERRGQLLCGRQRTGFRRCGVTALWRSAVAGRPTNDGEANRRVGCIGMVGGVGDDVPLRYAD